MLKHICSEKRLGLACAQYERCAFPNNCPTSKNFSQLFSKSYLRLKRSGKTGILMRQKTRVCSYDNELLVLVDPVEASCPSALMQQSRLPSDGVKPS